MLRSKVKMPDHSQRREVMASPLVPDLPNGGEGELLSVYRHAVGSSGEWASETVCMRMKDATFDIDVESGENNLER